MFSMGRCAMAQDKNMTPPPELNPIAIRYPEKTFYLGQVFNNTTNCYKLVWLLALLSLLERDAAMFLRLNDIFNEMAVIGWHPVASSAFHLAGKTAFKM
jgi:hypothetical protein